MLAETYSILVTTISRNFRSKLKFFRKQNKKKKIQIEINFSKKRLEIYLETVSLLL